VNLRRVALATAAATMAAAALAPAAHAWTQFSFASQSGSSEISVDGTEPYTRLEITRGAAVLSQSFSDSLTIGDLRAGDVATLYDGTSIVSSATYDGLPTAANACTGGTSFSATRAATAEIVDAGAYRSFAGSIGWVDSIWTADTDSVVSLARPLAFGDIAYVMTATTMGDIDVRSSVGVPAAACWPDRTPDRPVAPAPPPPVNPVTVAPSELVPTNAQLLQMVKGSLSASVSSLRTRTTRSLGRSSSVSVPFAFPEPGRVDLQLLAKHKVIGTAAKTSPTNGKAILGVRLTTVGRKLLKRSKQLKVTLRGTFAASRNGAATSSASLTLTMKR
jgi:hypothetical protein